MPELDGIAATRRIAGDLHARVLILTTFDLDEYVYDALGAGASGFLLKDSPPEQLVAIRVVAGGEALLAPSITSRLIEQFARTRAVSGESPPGLVRPGRAVATEQERTLGGSCGAIGHLAPHDSFVTGTPGCVPRADPLAE